MSLHSRTDYTRGQLDEAHVQGDPWSLLERWVNEAVDAGIQDPTAFTLSTIDAQGFPHGRVVLLRDTRGEELVFYTNYQSEKGRDLERTLRGGATFFWPHAERQIRVRGTVKRIPESESDAYFASRPRGSQLGAWSSAQSEHVDSRSELDASYQQQKARFDDQEQVPRPPHWGGYALVPLEIEFWQGRASRMHDRIRCIRDEQGAWSVSRLQP